MADKIDQEQIFSNIQNCSFFKISFFMSFMLDLREEKIELADYPSTGPI